MTPADANSLPPRGRRLHPRLVGAAVAALTLCPLLLSLLLLAAATAAAGYVLVPTVRLLLEIRRDHGLDDEEWIPAWMRPGTRKPEEPRDG